MTPIAGLLRSAGLPRTAALALLLLCVCGCAAFRSKGPVDPRASACRQFSCEGVTALESGNCEQAEKLLRKAVKASPQDADARRHLAEAFWARGERDSAINNMREAVKLEPKHAKTLCRLGQMEAESGQWSVAMHNAEMALSNDAKLADAWALRARAHMALGDQEQAMADLFRALEYAPNNRTVLTDLANLYAAQGKPHRRLATVHRLLETYPLGETPDRAFVMEADAYAALGRHMEAVEGLRVAAARTPGNAPLLFRLAEAEEAVGNRAAAVTAARRALEADQSHAPSQEMLARFDAQSLQLR